MRSPVGFKVVKAAEADYHCTDWLNFEKVVYYSLIRSNTRGATSDKNKLKLNFTRNNLKLDNSISLNSSSQRHKYESRKLPKRQLIPKVFDMGGAAKKTLGENTKDRH